MLYTHIIIYYRLYLQYFQVHLFHCTCSILLIALVTLQYIISRLPTQHRCCDRSAKASLKHLFMDRYRSYDSMRKWHQYCWDYCHAVHIFFCGKPCRQVLFGQIYSKHNNLQKKKHNKISLTRTIFQWAFLRTSLDTCIHCKSIQYRNKNNNHI